MSRAACSAMVASLACSDPTCLCASPLRLRMKTSQRGVFGVAITISFNSGRLGAGTLPTLLCVGCCRFAHPGAVFMCLAPGRDPVAVAWAVSGEHLLEFIPVDLAKLPMSGRLIQRHAGIRNCQSQKLRLRHRRVDEFLTKLVVGKALDLPPGRRVTMLARAVRRAEHHQHRP